ncbi:hypothetical protein JB92DRAFT_2748208 [Gautieria morchelliformis]|nr:hypothetical protein JB92DRAFT_2748208 [Gautieria morchelliformis]
MPSSTASSLHLPSPGLTIHLPTFYTHDTHDGRPKAAKNAGGVVGSLIATSRNLTGAAAPVPSTIAPNVKRKGFRLSRYEIAPETAQIELHEIGHRRARSAPTTPQLPLNTDLGVGDSTPASGTPGTRTPESTSDTATSLTNGRRKHVRHSLATLTEWMPPSLHSRFGSRASAAADDDASDPFDANKEHGKAYRRSRKKRRRKAEIFITKHVAEIMQRQEFLLKLARALMMFAAPTHRLQAQMQATARVLDLDISTLYLPNVMLISFDDAGTSTSNLKFIQQGSSLDLGKLLDAHRLYWKVIHDKISVSSASASLEFLMRKPPLYHGWQVVLLGGLCSSAICPLAFSGSFIDSLVVLPLGSLLVLVQNFSAKNELYSNVFEITIATLLSFISAALASTSRFCYAAVASSSVVLILPGFIVLSGSLELASRQIISGAVRTCFAVIYSLFLGFGLAMGADVYSRMTGLSVVGPDDFTCGSSHKSDGPWWQRTVSIWWAFLCVPLYSLFLSLRNQAPLWRKELAVTIFISCGGWAANHFAGLAFVGRPDIQSALGAFAVGIVANTYARFFSGNAYVVMITGILFQLPSGLANGGLLTFAANDNKGQQFQSYQAGFQVALQLVAVAIGLTVGLFTSVVIVHPLGGSRRRAAGLFSL